MKAVSSKGKKAEPFKTRKTREVETEANDIVTPPKDVAQAVDTFREFQEQAKHYEGEATVQKDIVLDFGQLEYSKRMIKGVPKSFKILGEQGMVTFVAMDASAGITEEEMESFAERWGKKAAEDLITRDLASIRFDGQVLEANYDAVVEALQVLPKDILESLFKPMLMKAKPGAVERAKKYAKSASELRDLIQQLKIRNYIR